jgi:hypothetical protein
MGAIILGIIAALICFWSVTKLKRIFGYDDSLDVFGVHCVGGIVGAILTGVFVAESLGGVGLAEGTTMLDQVGIQALGVAITLVWSAAVAFVAYKIADLTVGLRVTDHDPREGRHPVSPGERANTCGPPGRHRRGLCGPPARPSPEPPNLPLISPAWPGPGGPTVNSVKFCPGRGWHTLQWPELWVRVSIGVADMKRLSVASALLVLGMAAALTSVAVAQEASVYKWVDAQGIPHYSDQPPADISSTELPIRFRRTDHGIIQARAQDKAELEAASAIREGQEADVAAAAEADRQRLLAERASNCEMSRERVAKYSNAMRLYRPGPNGERVYLTNEELDAERADANRAVDQWCAGE